METLKPELADYARVEYLKQQSYERYGRPREEVEAEIRARYSASALPLENLTSGYGTF